MDDFQHHHIMSDRPARSSSKADQRLLKVNQILDKTN